MFHKFHLTSQIPLISDISHLPSTNPTSVAQITFDEMKTCVYVHVESTHPTYFSQKLLTEVPLNISYHDVTTS